MSRTMIKGNIAFAEAAVRGGLDFYAGYPITPSSEFMEYVSGRLPALNRIFVQAENEVASIHMLFGASASGKRAMTASSGPGTSLMQEGLSWCANYDLPGVILNVQRYGNGIGSLLSAQTDYHRDTRGGGQSDYRTIVLSPYTVQEGVDLAYNAFEIAEKHRMFVILHTEATLGQMSEAVEMPDFKPDRVKTDWAQNGIPHPLHGPNYSPHLPGCDPHDLVIGERERYARITDTAQMWQNYYTDDAEYIFVAYGLAARSCAGLVRRLRAQGEKVGLIRPISLWPYPEKAFREANPKAKAFIAVELNDFGQMVDDVGLNVKRVYEDRNVPVFSLPCVYGIPRMKKVTAFYSEVKAGKAERKY